MDLLTILEKTISPDQNELVAAQTFLEQAAQQNLPELLKELSNVLKNGGNSPVARMQAGLQLKNALYSKDAAIQTQHQQRWLQFSDDVKHHIKKNVLETLGTESMRPSSAAQCVAHIACTELPQQMWTEVISILTENVTNANSTEMVKEASLEAMGYICQDIDPDILETQANIILTAIVNGMKKAETSDHVRLAATTALLNSLEFTRANFDQEAERHYIMQVVCEATQSTNSPVRVGALQCLVKIMSLYYQYMEYYMGPALFAITIEAMKSEIDDVALQGIEFWSNVCDEEMDLAIEASEAQEQGRPPERTSKFYAKGALQYLIPIITQALTRQEEGDDDDEWNPCKAAGVCLMLMATCCEDDVVQYVLPFVKENISSGNWRFRDAAVMAFGSLLEGPDPTNLKPIVEQAMPMLINLLKDPSIAVRDTAAWTVGRVCEIVSDAVINEQYLTPLLEALVEGLSADPRVAANVCWAFSSLAEAAYEMVDTADDGSQPETYCLSAFFQIIVSKLLETTDRPDGSMHNLRSAAYEALMELVKNSPKDCYGTVAQTTIVILERLQKVLTMETHIQTSSDRQQFNDLQSILCATLQSVLRKVTADDAPEISDRIMAALLQMLNNSAGKAGGVQEDALLAVATLIEVLGEGFIKYVDAFMPYLVNGLRNIEEHQVCQAANGVVGDLCRAIGTQILPYSDDILVILLENLGNDNLNRKVKPQILSVLGDVALATGGEFKKYLEIILSTLQHATMAHIDKTDYDLIDYQNELWEGILEAYTGIVQGLKGDGENANPDVTLLLPHVPNIIQYIEKIAQDEDHTDSVIAAACGLLGDLTLAYGNNMPSLHDKDVITAMLTKGRRSKVSKTKALAVWTTKEIRKLRNASS